MLLIASQFAIDIVSVESLGNGLINDTYLVTTASSMFVLQRLNRSVFPFPKQIMANLKTFNEHIGQKNADELKLQFPEILMTQDQENFYLDIHGDYWRALSFIADTQSLEQTRCLEDARQAGFALGHFHRLLSDLNPNHLHDTLPDFHITPRYLKAYQQVLNTQSVHTPHAYCAEFIADMSFLVDELEIAKQQGLLVPRVIHGDPKLNNFLFTQDSPKIVSLIDLDTVKPGLVHYDIGDCCRSCCLNPETGEFDLDLCRALLKSYLSEAGVFFTEQDYHFLYCAIWLIPFELGLRFYTDYLQGNRYFKVTEKNQNLQRAISQFRLCQSIKTQENDIKHLIAELKC